MIPAPNDPEKKDLEIPTGGLSLVFTDIEGSSALWEQLRDGMSSVLERHHAILRHLSECHRGYEVKTEGDSFFLYFEEAENALDFCLEAQRLLHEEPWPEDVVACRQAAPSADGSIQGLRVRMGIHHGRPIIKVDPTTGRIDLHGPVVNAAARISDAAHGGQTVISDRFWEQVDKGRYPNLVRDSLGEHRLKGMEFTYSLHDVRPRELAGRSFPELRTVRGVRHNLPQRPTSFVGRETELEDLGALLDQGHRLITVTGAGGSGKTRTTLRLAAARLDRYPGGVWFVPLMDVTTREGVVQATAGVLGIALRAELQEDHVASELVKREPTLLVFDNFEQLAVESSDLLEFWLEAAPGIQMLVSSQVPLKTGPEHVYALEPLNSPTVGEIDRLGTDASVLEDAPAVRLFLERARTANRGFEADTPVLGDIARICAKLDGIPLAIELAAARCHMLSPKQILERMPKRFALLKGSGKDKRKSTLLGAVQWSWGLLSPWEQSTLMQSTVFTGGFTLDMAEGVIDVDGFDDAPLVMDVVQNLLERNLLRSWRPKDHPEEVRYDHYDSVRGFLQSIIEGDTGGALELVDRARQRYDDWMVALCLQDPSLFDTRKSMSSTLFKSPASRAIMGNRLDFIGCHRRAVGPGSRDGLDVNSKIQLTTILGNVLTFYGHHLECYDVGSLMYENLPSEASLEQRMSAITKMINPSPYIKRNHLVKPIVESFLEEARSLGDDSKVATLLISQAYLGTGNMTQEERRDLWLESLKISKAKGFQRNLPVLQVNLSHVESVLGNYETSIAYAQDMIDATEEDNMVLKGMASQNIASALTCLGRYSEALVHLEKTLEIFSESGFTNIDEVSISQMLCLFIHGDMERLKVVMDARLDGGVGEVTEAYKSMLAHVVSEISFEIGQPPQLSPDLVANPAARCALEADQHYLRGELPKARQKIGDVSEVHDAYEFLNEQYSVPRCLSKIADPGAVDMSPFVEDQSRRRPVYSNFRYHLSQGHLSLSAGNLEDAKHHVEETASAVENMQLLETSHVLRLHGELVGAYEEFCEARAQGRPARLFRGHLPETLPRDERRALWADLDAKSRKSLPEEVAKALQDH